MVNVLLSDLEWINYILLNLILKFLCQALKEALARIRICSKIEGLLLKKKALKSGDTPEIHAQKVYVFISFCLSLGSVCVCICGCYLSISSLTKLFHLSSFYNVQMLYIVTHNSMFKCIILCLSLLHSC